MGSGTVSSSPDAPGQHRAASEPDFDESSVPRGRWRIYAAAIVLLGATAFGVWWSTQSSAPAPAAVPIATPAPTPTVPPPPPTFAPAEANRRAVDVLRQHLTVESLRVRRVAAAALGRQADPQAIAALMELLPTEQSEIAKLDIAYGLARAGDARGLEILLAGLRSPRRDIKGDAARLLAALKDMRAESTLTSLLNLTQFRLSAAEQLARLGNKSAIALLEKIRVDDKVAEEDRLRATIALGYSGQASVTDSLRALLPDVRFNVDAAGALAVLGDASARPVLLTQLSISSLRVSAAVALRRLDPELDASSILYRLMPDLDSSKDTERVAAAEAILLLTGPKSVAERD
jgi:HEAT repeat protein